MENGAAGAAASSYVPCRTYTTCQPRAHVMWQHNLDKSASRKPTVETNDFANKASLVVYTLARNLPMCNIYTNRTSSAGVP